MTDEKNNPHLQSKLSPFPGPSQLRQQAEQKAKAIALPDLDSMSHEEIRHMMYEMQIKQIEADLLVKQLRSQREEKDDQAERLRIVTENMLDMVALTDMEGNFTYAGKAHEILGYKPGFLIGKNVLDFVHPEDFPYIMNEFGELVESGLPRKVEYRYRCADGTYLWLETMGNVIKDENGIPQKIVFSSRDITERKSREDERRELIGRLLALINSAGDLREIISALLASLQSWSGAAAVGIRLADGEDFPYYETRGFPPEFIEAEKYLCAYGPDGQILRNGRGNPVLECMCGNVISGSCDPSKPFFTNHGSFWTHSTSALLAGTTKADRQGRTRNRCHGEGYESVALIPLRTGDQVFGLLQFNDPRPEHFACEQVAYFESVADSIAAGLALRQAEESRLESEAKYRMLFDSIDAGFCIIEMLFDSEGKPVDYVFLEANPAFVKHTGLVDAIGRRVRDLNPEQEEHWFEIYGEIAITGKPRRFVESAVLIDGWYEGYAFSIGGPGTNRVAVLFRGITEAKQTEEALRESEEKFRIVFEQSAIGMGLVNFTDARWVDVNETFCNMLGYTPEEMRTTPWPDITHPDDVDYDLMPFRRMAAGNLENYTVEKRFIHKQGHHVWARLTLSLVRDVHGRPDYEIAIIENITQRKMAEKDLQALRDTLEHQVAERTELAEARSRQLQKLTVDLIEAEERERRRIASLLHDDLQQLLASAKLQVQITRERHPSIELLKNIESTLKEAIEESRDLSHELTPPVLQQGDLIDTIEWLAYRIKKQFGLQVSVEKTAPSPRFKNVPLKLFIYRAVQELLFNTVKHSGVENAWIIFSGNNDSFSIAVTDQGRGFDPDILSSHEKVGLGLSSLAQRANSIGCNLDIKTTPGQGSRITLTIPVSLVENDGIESVQPG